VLPEHLEHARGVAAAVASAEPADRELDPEQRDPDHEQTHEVGNQERAAAVQRGLAREAQEVPEPDRVARERQHEPDLGRPPLARHAHPRAPITEHEGLPQRSKRAAPFPP